MSVHFIGAGPGAADLITVRGRDLLGQCPVCLYAGSIVPPDLLRYCPAGARLVDTAPLTLDDIEAECVAAHAAGQDVARLQSGDLSVFSAVAEQIRRLERRGIPYTLTPGVPAFAAAAALLRRELVRRDRCDARASPRHSSHQHDCRRADAGLRRRLPRRRGGARDLAGPAHRAGHPRRHRRQARDRKDRAHRRYPDRASVGRARFPRQRAL